MLTFPRTHARISEMAEKALLETDTARDIVRKAGLSGTTIAEDIGLVGGIMGTFSLINSATGFTLSYPGGTSLFPDGTLSMRRYADISSITQVRLIAKIVAAGSGTLRVESAGLLSTPEISIASAGLKVSGWCELSGTEAVFDWRVSSSSGGSVTFGLCQLQGR